MDLYQKELFRLRWSPISYNAIYLGSIGIDHVILSDFCYEETILQRNYGKMTILWPFSSNSFVKFHG